MAECSGPSTPDRFQLTLKGSCITMLYDMTPTRKLTAFRIDDDLLAGIEQAAAEDDRPVSYVIRQAIKAWLESRHAAHEKPTRKPRQSKKRR